MFASPSLKSSSTDGPSFAAKTKARFGSYRICSNKIVIHNHRTCINENNDADEINDRS